MMYNIIREWIEDYYANKYCFDDVSFVRIINGLADILSELSEEDALYVNSVLQKILDKYTIKDYYYVIELFEYEFLPLFIEEEK